jgi:DNA primase small subunit
LLCVDGKHPACDQSYFGRREFSYTLDNDIYLRFQSFNTASELENSIKEKCPFKIDIGPVYSVDVRFLLDHSYDDDSICVFINNDCLIDLTCPPPELEFLYFVQYMFLF